MDRGDITLAERLADPVLREAALDQLRVQFSIDRVTPIRPMNHGPTVTIDGEPYATFGDEVTARAAIIAWEKRWPAAAGKRLEIR